MCPWAISAAAAALVRQVGRSKQVLVRAQREHEAARLLIVQARREEDTHCLLLPPAPRRQPAGWRLGRWAAVVSNIHGYHREQLVAQCHPAAWQRQQLAACRSQTRAFELEGCQQRSQARLKKG